MGNASCAYECLWYYLLFFYLKNAKSAHGINHICGGFFCLLKRFIELTNIIFLNIFSFSLILKSKNILYICQPKEVGGPLCWLGYESALLATDNCKNMGVTSKY